jgi:hypothetical protein
MTTDTSNKGAAAQATTQDMNTQFQKKVEKKLPMIKVPDLFKNVKIKKPNYLKY